MQSNLLENLVANFENTSVLILGESVLDSYLMGNTDRLCREAPAPIIDIAARHETPGGAAHAAVNIATLGGNAIFLSIVGNDDNGHLLRERLDHYGVNTEHMVVDGDYQTLVKQRISADDHILVRCDHGSIAPIRRELEARLIEQLEMIVPHCEIILVSDYDYGILTPAVINFLAQLRPYFEGVVAVDSKRLPLFSPVRPTLVKPSYEQAMDLLDLPSLRGNARLQQIEAHRDELLHRTGAAIVAVTLDVDGAMIFEDGRPPYRTQTKPADHANAVGAGDTYIGTFALGLAAGGLTHQAADLAAYAGQVVVSEPGTTPCRADFLLDYLRRGDLIHQKRVERSELAACVERHRRQNRRIVFTNGCFDILHAGHVQYLAQAKALGDVLIVGVNSDASVMQLKGPERPISALAERLTVLAALEKVDHVVSFNEETPHELIRVIRPDIYVKGGDYSKESLPEASLVTELGGRVEIMPYVMNRSTTQIINRIRRNVRKRNGRSAWADSAYGTGGVDTIRSTGERL
ncbi:D-glycero-beta-D-manno-heptose 1-phosphate adenylyltransferase [bacterium]|nr:D-glycero-beta-D-manno-heptose 1-phosphate adenylyltransferase [bacterium]